jgi:hypothetical protein
MAVPYVTGAWAVINVVNGIASVTDLEKALKTAGVSISTPAGNTPRNVRCIRRSTRAALAFSMG